MRRCENTVQTPASGNSFADEMARATSTAPAPCAPRPMCAREKLVDLPKCSAFCPNRNLRPSVRIPEPKVCFKDLIVTAPTEVMNEEPLELPIALRGMDPLPALHRVLSPGYEDLAGAASADHLTDALWFNQIVPNCACTKALFAAADRETFIGVLLASLEQEA